MRSILLLLLAVTVDARACQICLPMPVESLADHILDSKYLVLAREDPDQPFTLRPVRTLGGGAPEPPPMDLFLDSSNRRRLSLDENLGILCGWSPEAGEWRRLALHDEVLAPVVQHLLEHRDAWQADPTKRLRYFAGFLGHDDAVLSDLAHIEVARAPHGQLMQFADRLPREELHKRLANFRRIEWHALYILFLARNGNEADHELIREEVARAAEFGLRAGTAAWATALIEIDGVAGIDRIAQLYCDGSVRAFGELAAIHAALRVHADDGRPGLREPIIAAYGEMLAAHPGFAPELAADLTRWNRFDHADAFATLLRDPHSDLRDPTPILTHLQAADSSTAQAAPTGRPGLVSGFALAGGLVLIPLFLALLGRPGSAKAPPTTRS